MHPIQGFRFHTSLNHHVECKLELGDTCSNVGICSPLSLVRGCAGGHDAFSYNFHVDHVASTEFVW